MLYFRGMQQIYDQIKQHLEEKQVEDEIKEQEGQQIREKQERMNLEDLEVQMLHTHKHANTHVVHAQGGSATTCTVDRLALESVSSSRPWRRRSWSNSFCRRRSCA